MSKTNEVLTGYHDQGSIHSNKVDQNVDFGAGRYYECVFCRRGFNTAQALGGHMNIHRKDRARNNKPNNNTSSKRQQQVEYYCPGLYQQMNITPPASSSIYNNRREALISPVDWRIEDLATTNRQEMDADLDLELRLGYDS